MNRLPKPWEDHLNDHKNRLAPRADFSSYYSEEDARRGEREDAYGFKSLNGAWHFLFLDAPEYAPENFYKTSFDVTAQDLIQVPGCWQMQGYGKMHYADLWYNFPIQPPFVPTENPTGIYTRSFTLTEAWSRMRVILRFHGVDSFFQLWINGQEVGQSKGARYQAEFDVTDFVRIGENKITVLVTQWSDGTYLEDQDMWWLSGIFRDVELYGEPLTGIDDFQIITNLDDAYIDSDLKVHTKLRIHEKDKRTFMKNSSITYLLLDENEETIFKEEQRIEAASLDFTKKVKGPKLWSAENPTLYTLLFILKLNDEIIQVIPQKVGFRSIERKGKILTLNGKPIKLRGVNRHEFNPKNGRTVSVFEMAEDIKLMKQHNINGIRTSHYPNGIGLYDLCDKYGMYLIEEADLECHGFELTGDFNWISDDPEWETAYVNRMERMVMRTRNHPSILLWSLGNESGFGCNFIAMAEKGRALDPTRLLHYEGDEKVKVADVYSTMYTWLEDIDPRSKGRILMRTIIKETKAPHIHCEFGHAMGNGPGCLKDYMDLVYKHEQLAGGFIWEWADHGIHSVDSAGKTYYRYGGNFGDEPNNGNFCIDGMVMPDKTPSPGLLELKKVYEPIETSAVDLEEGILQIKNRFDFRSLEGIELIYRIHSGEKQLAFGKMMLPKIFPWKSRKIKLPYPKLQMLEKIQTPGEDAYLTMEYRLSEDTSWAKAGHCIATGQEKLPLETILLEPKKKTGTLLFDETSTRLDIKGVDFSVAFDKVRGRLLYGEKDGCRIIEKGPALQFWRAPIDNDMYVVKDYKEKDFLHLFHEIVTDFSFEKREDSALVKVSCINGPTNSAWHYESEYTYEIFASGDLLVNIKGTPAGRLEKSPAMLPRIGLKLQLGKDYEMVKWMGRGPHEAYSDSKEAALFGVYEKTVDDLFTNYVKPQENGNRHECRWVRLLNDRGIGAMVKAEDQIDFSAMNYEIEDLELAKHTKDLKKRDYVVLNLDYKQNGLGSNACGQSQLKKHRCTFEPFEMSFRLSLYSNRETTDQAQASKRITKEPLKKTEEK